MKNHPTTFVEALDKYFGGVQKLSRSKIPFTCICGDKSFSLSRKSDKSLPIMRVEDCYRHIRRNHREILKKNL